MKECIVYQDGKLGRGVPAKIIKEQSKRILIEFEIEEYNEEVDDWVSIIKPRWFVRRYRTKGGAYECIGWNYWFYRKTT